MKIFINIEIFEESQVYVFYPKIVHFKYKHILLMNVDFRSNVSSTSIYVWIKAMDLKISK